MILSVRTLLVIGVISTILPALADAADLPKRKSGLWEITTSHEGAPGMVMQVCIDEKQDNLAAQQSGKMDQDIRQQCSRMDTKQAGDRIEIDSVCRFGKVTAIGHSVISGQMSTQYRMESTTRYEPPMHGMARSHMVMTGRWLGPCKPGQKHGAMSLSGMPGGGQFNLDADTLKQMEKLQQQYGR